MIRLYKKKNICDSRPETCKFDDFFFFFFFVKCEIVIVSSFKAFTACPAGKWMRQFYVIVLDFTFLKESKSTSK